jgi:hypothetical protein
MQMSVTEESLIRICSNTVVINSFYISILCNYIF